MHLTNQVSARVFSDSKTLWSMVTAGICGIELAAVIVRVLVAAKLDD